MKRLFQKFFPIIVECNQGQKRLGVKDGGHLLYKEIFSKMSEPYIFPNKTFDSSIGFKKLFNFCKKIENPLVLGGDHAIGASTVMASIYKYPNVKVFWIDAHGDINTFNSSISKNRHGMPVAMCVGLDKLWWRGNNIKLPFENLIYVGLRDLDKFEEEIIKKHKIKVFNVKKAVDYIKKCDEKIHISLDVDALDPKYLDSTGTIADNGLTPLSVRKIIESGLIGGKLVGLDIAEYNPELGDNKKSLVAMKKIF